MYVMDASAGGFVSTFFHFPTDYLFTHWFYCLYLALCFWRPALDTQYLLDAPLIMFRFSFLAFPFRCASGALLRPFGYFSAVR
jgi:hypothetical protein